MLNCFEMSVICSMQLGLPVPPFSSDGQHLSCDGCLEAELFCVVLCTEAAHSHKHMRSSYSSLDWVLSHWAHFTVRRFICVYLCVICGPDWIEAYFIGPYLPSVL